MTKMVLKTFKTPDGWVARHVLPVHGRSPLLAALFPSRLFLAACSEYKPAEPEWVNTWAQVVLHAAV